MSTATATPAITAEMLAALVLGRSTAVVVVDQTGTIHSLDRLDRFQQDDPDTVVLLTRDEAIAVLSEAAHRATQALVDHGVLS